MRWREIQEALDIPREVMPQLTDVDLEQDHDVELETVKLGSLKTSQDDRVEGKVEDIKRKIRQGDHPDPIVVDTNDHIVDGHHRYEAYRDLGYDEIQIQRVDAELPDLIQQYQDTAVSESLGMGKKSMQILIDISKQIITDMEAGVEPNFE